MANVDATTRSLEERITSSFRIGYKSLNFTLTKSNKRMQRVVFLEAGQEDLPEGGLEAQMMLDCTFSFPA